MPYIIDANNLAGKLKMLGEINFDKKLTEIIKKYNHGQSSKIILVFDGSDPMGDKITVNENIAVIHSPKDKFYKSADDKIVEMVETRTDLNSLTIITDDSGLRRRLEQVGTETGKDIKIERATPYAEKLKLFFYAQTKENTDDDRGLKKNDINKINNELLKIWGNK